MTDPYEEERQERFVRPIEPMLMILDEVRRKLSAVRNTRQAGEAIALYDNAMDELFALLDLGKPLAFRLERNGRLAFMWVENGGQPSASFRWVVCSADGSCQRGKEQSQRECEAAVDRCLDASE